MNINPDAALAVGLTILAVLTWAGICFGVAYYSFKPILDEQRERHAKDQARWDRDRERMRRWNKRHQ